MEERSKRKVYSKEFRSEAAELANRLGFSKAGEELGVHPTTIRNWHKKLQGGKSTSGQSNKSKSYEELEKENKRLQKELGYLKEINKVLKKSTAIFSADQLGSTK